jgi:hypothetical protein
MSDFDISAEERQIPKRTLDGDVIDGSYRRLQTTCTWKRQRSYPVSTP